MAAMHELLDETQKRCEDLVKEIEGFRSSRVVQEQAASALEAVCAALVETRKAVKPFTDTRIRRLYICVIGCSVLNTVLFIAALVLLLLAR